MKRCVRCNMEWNDYLTADLVVKQGGHADVSCIGPNRQHEWRELDDRASVRMEEVKRCSPGLCGGTSADYETTKGERR